MVAALIAGSKNVYRMPARALRLDERDLGLAEEVAGVGPAGPGDRDAHARVDEPLAIAEGERRPQRPR